MGLDLSVWFALAFIAAVHLLAGHLRFLSSGPRSRWLSAGGGVAVAYAFLHLLPELHAHQQVLRETASGAWSFLQHHAYIAALAGLAAFYGLERWAKRSKAESQRSEPGATSPQVFWVSIGAFALYNALLCYLIGQQSRKNGTELLLFSVAVAVHFAVNDHSLYRHHKTLYARYGRWLLAGAAVLGGLAGRRDLVPGPIMAALMAFLIGAILLNVLKEELPEERESRFGSFLLGTLGYSALLLAI
jgi:zinc transporter ZupT